MTTVQRYAIDYATVGNPAGQRCYNKKYETVGLIVTDYGSIYVKLSNIPQTASSGSGSAIYYPMVELKGIGRLIARLYIWMITKIVADTPQVTKR